MQVKSKLWIKVASYKATWVLASLLLAACGGGDDKPPASADRQDASGPVDLVDEALLKPVSATSFDGSHAWQVTTVADGVMGIQYTGSEDVLPPEEQARLMWVAASEVGALSLKFSQPWKGVAWQPARTLVDALEDGVDGAERRIVSAGGWTLVVWTPYDWSAPAFTPRPVYARLTGPGQDSGAVRIANDVFSLHDALLAVSPEGKARVYFGDPDDHTTPQAFIGGHFEGLSWVPEPSFEIVDLDSSRLHVGSDGQGWLFSGGWGDWVMRRFDAASGIGEPVQVTDAMRLGSSNFNFLVKPLPNGRLLAMTLHEKSHAEPKRCLAAREFDGSKWGEIVCVNQLLNFDLSGNGLDLKTTPDGRALLVWTGEGDRQVMAAVRSSQGVWSSLGTAGGVYSGAFGRIAYPFDIQALIGEDGQYAVIFRGEILSGTYPKLDRQGVLHVARWRNNAWGPTQQIDDLSVNTLRYQAAFDRAGNIGVLSMDKVSGNELVRFSTQKADGSWMAHTLQDHSRFIYTDFYGEKWLYSDLRLVAMQDGTWTATWTLNPSSEDLSGLRIMGATLR